MIDKFIHFVDNECLGDTYLWVPRSKPFMIIWPSDVILCTHYVSIDESLLLWKGRLENNIFQIGEADLELNLLFCLRQIHAMFWNSQSIMAKNSLCYKTFSAFHCVGTKIVLWTVTIKNMGGADKSSQMMI